MFTRPWPRLRETSRRISQAVSGDTSGRSATEARCSSKKTISKPQVEAAEDKRVCHQKCAAQAVVYLCHFAPLELTAGLLS